MAAFFLVIAMYPALSRASPRPWALMAAAVFFSLAMLIPKALSLPNRWWTKLGLLISAFVSPVALGILFFGVITPYGWLMKKCGKISMPTAFDPAAESYWITRNPAGPDPESLQNQF